MIDSLAADAVQSGQDRITDRGGRELATPLRRRGGLHVNSRDGDKKQLPVALPPVADELLSSWIARHGAFYNVSSRAMLPASAPILRSSRQAWRITCPSADHTCVREGRGVPPTVKMVIFLRLVGRRPRGPAPARRLRRAGHSDLGVPNRRARPLLIPRDPKPIDPKHWIETRKVLDLLVPGCRFALIAEALSETRLFSRHPKWDWRPFFCTLEMGLIDRSIDVP
jgi:hypothetical protein